MNAVGTAGATPVASTTVDPPPRWTWLGRAPFDETFALQERLRAGILSGNEPETLLLVEHDPVITLGRSTSPGDVLASTDLLRARGIAVSPASRGGAATYHGPGQLVGYPVVRLRAGVRAFVEAMAAAAAAVLRDFDISARYRREAPGLWVSSGPNEKKICSFGIHVHRRVAIHGFALNLSPDLDAFNLIVPCGQPATRATSIFELVGQAPSPAELAPRVAQALATELAIPFTRA